MVSLGPRSPISALPPPAISQGCTSMHFGENQLSPGSLGISPLPTAHPSLLPQTSVRASTPHYGSFTLAMGSSPGFGSPPTNMRPVQTRFRSGSGTACLNRAGEWNSPAHSSIGTPSPRLTPKALTAWRLTGSGLFHSPPGVLFTFPSRYWFTIGRSE